MRTNALPVSYAKISIPGLRPEILPRARLLEMLEDLLDKRLVLITAPAGYGKTSLLINLAHKTEMPICWLSLDVLDQEPQRFLSYFIAAIAWRFPQFGNLSNTALANLTTLEHGLENLIVTVVNEIADQINENFALVLDDYQFVDNITEISNFISRFIQLSGENCHVVLASRRLPALPDIAILVARQQIGGFDMEELAFRPDEIRMLFEQTYAIQLSQRVLDELARQTEGWVTGLHIARPGMTQKIPDLTRAARAAGVDLSDYFDEQVLKLQPPEVQDFLLQTSLLNEFDAGLCDAVLGVGSWSAVIDSITRSNLFVLAVGPRGDHLRYHHLFQEYLQERVWRDSPEVAQAILLRLTEVSEENSEWDRAYYVLRQLGDPEAVAELVERAGLSLIQNDRILTLGTWLDALAETQIQERPDLLALKGLVKLFRGEIYQGLSWLDQAAQEFAGRGDAQKLAMVNVRRSAAYRQMGKYQDALENAEEAIWVTASDPGQQDTYAEALRMKGLSLFRLGEGQEASEWLQRSLQVYTDMQHEKNTPRVQMELGMVCRALGDYPAALRWYETALAGWQALENISEQAFLHNSLGVLYHARGDYEHAFRSFESGLDCARRSGLLHAEVLLLTSMGDLFTEITEFELARQLYQDAEETARRISYQFPLNYSLLAQAALARATRTFDIAFIQLEKIQAYITQGDSHYEKGLYNLEYGRLLFSLGEAGKSVDSFESAMRYFNQGGLVLEKGWSQLWLAAAKIHLGDQQGAVPQIKEALKLASGHQAHAISMVAFELQAWLNGLKQDPEIGPELTRLLDYASQVHSRLPTLRRKLRRTANIIPLPPRMTIQAFGKAQVRVNGKLLNNSQWQSRSVKELFFFFLHNPAALTKEQIGEVFWPESSPDQLKLRFKNDLYRLRRALGQDVILFDGNRYRFNHDLDFEYDVETYLTNLSRARKISELAEKIQAYQDAISVVRGLYLEDLDSTWVLPERERFRQKYLAALLNLAGLLLDNGKEEEALQTCQYALASDSCLEEAHRLIMRAHASLGDRQAVARQYQVCRNALDNELGLRPSSETEALYLQLIS
ncbi:MAG: tetratricopeptide repeat protein [Chloroflexota bacterium]